MNLARKILVLSVMMAWFSTGSVTAGSFRFESGYNICVDRVCDGNDITFIISNKGKMPSDEFVLSIVEDDIILFIQNGLLNPGETWSFTYPDVGELYEVKINFLFNGNQADIDKFFNTCNNILELKGGHGDTGVLPAEDHYGSTEGQFGPAPAGHLKPSGPVLLKSVKQKNGKLELYLDSASGDFKFTVNLFGLNGKLLHQEGKTLTQGENVVELILPPTIPANSIFSIRGEVQQHSLNLLLFY